MATRIAIDVDRTLVDEDGNLIEGAFTALCRLKDKGFLLILWSACGEEYARTVARKYKLCCFFDEYSSKPDFGIDDQPETIGRLPMIDARAWDDSHRGWETLQRMAINLAADCDAAIARSTTPDWIDRMIQGANRNRLEVQCASAIWEQRNAYIRWPSTGRLLMPGVLRHQDGSRKDCYDYPPELVEELLAAGLDPTLRRNNDPAIFSYLLAGGDRPRRPFPNSWSWTIHHIYDGLHRHPLQRDLRVPRSVSDPNHFTHSAGLVALHPFADSVVAESPMLAWLLRLEAFVRFNYDPMGVFQTT